MEWQTFVTAFTYMTVPDYDTKGASSWFLVMDAFYSSRRPSHRARWFGGHDGAGSGSVPPIGHSCGRAGPFLERGPAFVLVPARQFQAESHT
jgi:hypothetical protein